MYTRVFADTAVREATPSAGVFKKYVRYGKLSENTPQNLDITVSENLSHPRMQELVFATGSTIVVSIKAFSKRKFTDKDYDTLELLSPFYTLAQQPLELGVALNIEPAMLEVLKNPDVNEWMKEIARLKISLDQFIKLFSKSYACFRNKFFRDALKDELNPDLHKGFVHRPEDKAWPKQMRNLLDRKGGEILTPLQINSDLLDNSGLQIVLRMRAISISELPNVTHSSLQCSAVAATDRPSSVQHYLDEGLITDTFLEAENAASLEKTLASDVIFRLMHPGAAADDFCLTGAHVQSIAETNKVAIFDNPKVEYLLRHRKVTVEDLLALDPAVFCVPEVQAIILDPKYSAFIKLGDHLKLLLYKVVQNIIQIFSEEEIQAIFDKLNVIPESDIKKLSELYEANVFDFGRGWQREYFYDSGKRSEILQPDIFALLKNKHISLTKYDKLNDEDKLKLKALAQKPRSLPYFSSIKPGQSFSDRISEVYDLFVECDDVGVQVVLPDYLQRYVDQKIFSYANACSFDFSPPGFQITMQGLTKDQSVFECTNADNCAEPLRQGHFKRIFYHWSHFDLRLISVYLSKTVQHLLKKGMSHDALLNFEPEFGRVALELDQPSIAEVLNQLEVETAGRMIRLICIDARLQALISEYPQICKLLDILPCTNEDLGYQQKDYKHFAKLAKDANSHVLISFITRTFLAVPVEDRKRYEWKLLISKVQEIEPEILSDQKPRDMLIKKISDYLSSAPQNTDDFGQQLKAWREEVLKAQLPASATILPAFSRIKDTLPEVGEKRQDAREDILFRP